MIYVACSRATTAQGLFIVTESFKAPRPPTSKDAVVKEMAKLREKPIVPIFKFLRERHNFTQIMYHNVQSLKHIPDIVSDPQILASDIYFTSETWSCTEDSFSLPDFVEVVRTYGPKTAASYPGFGISAWVKQDLHITSSTSYFQHSSTFGQVEAVSFEYNSHRIFALYKSPRCTNKTFMEFINKNVFSNNNMPTLLYGDFNEDFLKDNCILSFMQNAGYRTLLPPCPTTRGGTQIDNIFGNFYCQTGIIYILACLAITSLYGLAYS